jgi:hypothetical protein
VLQVLHQVLQFIQGTPLGLAGGSIKLFEEGLMTLL